MDKCGPFRGTRCWKLLLIIIIIIIIIINCNWVAVVILHEHKCGKKRKIARKFKSGRLHERRVVKYKVLLYL